MEKIYMEENQSQKNSNKGMYRFSIVLSFAVAIFAMVSLGMAGIVINQGTGVSYAAPTADSFTIKHGKIYQITGTSSNANNMQMIAYYSNSVSEANRVYCIERALDAAADGSSYAKTENKRNVENYPDLKNDAGLVYLLSINASTDNFAGLEPFDDKAKVVQGIMVQSAIWKYLATKYPNVATFKLVQNQSGMNDAAVMDIDSVKISQKNASDTSFTEIANVPLFKTTINKLVNNANNATLPNITVSKENDEISLTDDEKYYQSAAITVAGNPSSKLINYDAALEGIDGAIAVDESGNELNLAGVDPSKKFYVRIPAEKITKTVQKVTVNVTGHFKDAAVSYYVNSDTYQRIGGLAPGNFNGGTEVEFVGSDNTGMNTAQTIYFIGLIVLLCGVGIVYANARPVESKQ